MRDSFALRGGVEYVHHSGAYVQTYPEPESEPIDVWLRIPADREEAEAEANTFRDGDGYRVDWYLTAVGLVKSARFDTYEDATVWLTGEGFQDFTS